MIKWFGNKKRTFFCSIKHVSLALPGNKFEKSHRKSRSLGNQNIGMDI